MNIDSVWLRSRYLDDQAPISVIAAEAGVTVSSIHRAINAAGIPRRGKPGSAARVVLDRDWLATRHAEGLSWGAIATIAGVDRSMVVWQAARYGLADVSDSQRERATYAAERYRRGHSLREVAAALGVGRKQVTVWLRGLGVEIRRPCHPRREDRQAIG